MSVQRKAEVNINIRVSPAERSKFQRACRRNGHTQSDVLRKMIGKYADGSISFTETLELS